MAVLGLRPHRPQRHPRPTLEDDFPGRGPAVLDALVESPDGTADVVAMSQPLQDGGERARAVLMLHEPDAAVVVDRTRVRDGRDGHRVETLWNLPTSYEAERVDADTVRAVDAEAGEATTLVQIRLDGAAVAEDGIALHRGDPDPEARGHRHRGFYFPDGQVREETVQVAFGSRGATAGIVSVLIPAGAEDEAVVEAEHHDDGSLTLEVRGAEGTARVGIDAEGMPTRLD